MKHAAKFLNSTPVHPGPLPQERGNGSPFSDEVDASGCRTCLEANDKGAAFATVADAFSSAAAALTLSSGERAGVRAGVRASLEYCSRLAVVTVLGVRFNSESFFNQITW